ncbi:F-box protein At3g12350 [Malania oleifera]|uniref:F-box protein At3g12350 n=1 Tax=Malania oleifera TaxID=397392 RepID=UPI0025AE7C5A|nr:F-box protein At3g12350 [Malania oleifera]
MENLQHSNLPIQEQVFSSDYSLSFSYFPEDVLLCILSFLSPSDVSAFACTSKRFVTLCRSDSKLWYAMCDRRWGCKTQIRKWGGGKIAYKQLYRTLDEWENLMGFWRRSGQGSLPGGVTSPPPPPLVFFEWGPSFVTGSKVSPSKSGTYQVIKAPFLWMSLSAHGEVVNYLDPDCRIDLSGDFVNSDQLEFFDADLVPVSVSFMGKSHLVVEETRSFGFSCSPEQRRAGFQRSSSSASLRGEDGGIGEDVIGVESGSPGSLPDRLMSEIYQHFANRTSPGSERASRRQRKREKERQWSRKWELEHYVKIENCSPTPSRPLQGLWKGICEGMNLDFYLVAYDDIGGIACRRVGDSYKPFSGYSPVFWTSDSTFLESPFSREEVYLYESRIHLQPLEAANCIDGGSALTENEEVSGILYINSSYDLVIPDLAGTANPWHVEGRIWQYRNGTFGFGFLRDNFIIDLKHIAQNGCLLDTSVLYSD